MQDDELEGAFDDWNATREEKDSDPETAALLKERADAQVADVASLPLGTPSDVAAVITERGLSGTEAVGYAADIVWRLRQQQINDDARRVAAARLSDGSVPSFDDVAAAVRGEIPDLLPTMFDRSDGTCLVYPGLLHWLYGPPGRGKSLIAALLCVQVLNRGGTCGYLDWEGNRAMMGDRLRALGARAEDVAERFFYARPGNLEPHKEWLADQAAGWDLCVYDGTARALAASGRDEERNPEVLAWMEAVITPVTEAGCAAVMLDHVTNDPMSRDRPRGASAKMGEVSGAAWELRSGTPFNRGTAGFAKLIQRKDREGRTGVDGEVVAEVHFEPAGRGVTRWAVKVPGKGAADLAHGGALEKTWKTVNSIVAANLTANTNTVHKMQGGDKGKLSAMLDELVDMGHLRAEPGPKNMKVWVPVTPYLGAVPEPPPGTVVPRVLVPEVAEPVEPPPGLPGHEEEF